MKITILGTGAYGLAMSAMFLENNCDITMWTKFLDEKKLIEENGCHINLLPNYKVSNKIKITTNIEEAVNDADIIVIAIPIKFVRDTILDFYKYYKEGQHICIASKGIEQTSYLFIYDMINEYIKTDNVCVASGGTFAEDMATLIPAGLTIASKSNETKKAIKKSLENRYLRLEFTDDIIGVEMYGAIKNVIAIGSGMIDGMGYPESTKSMYLTKSINALIEIVSFLGGNKDTIMTYAGIGDLLLTCNSDKSRNYTLGRMFGERKDTDIIEEYINSTTIEGLYTLKSIYDLINSKNGSFPIINVIYDIVYNHEDINKLNEYLGE